MKPTRRITDRGLRGVLAPDTLGSAPVSSLSNKSIGVDAIKKLWIANFCYSIASSTSIESWLAQRDPFRAVGIWHSRPFSLVRCPKILEFADFYEAHVESQVRPILQKHHINTAAISLSRRGCSNRPLTEIDYPHTLLVNTRDEYPDTWTSAAQEIQEAFWHAGIPNQEIEVEICKPDKIKYMVSHVFAVYADFLEDVESVKQGIVDEVTALCGLAWSSIAFPSGARNSTALQRSCRPS